MNRTMNHMPASAQRKRLGVFERYLSVWVGLCMVFGVLLGRFAPQLVQSLRSVEFGDRQSHQSADCVADLAHDYSHDDESGLRLHTTGGRQPKGSCRNARGQLACEAVLDGALGVVLFSGRLRALDEYR